MLWRTVMWLVLALILGGCGQDPLTKQINAAFPPINVEQQRQTAIDTNVDALTKLGSPNIALAVSLADAKAVLLETLKKDGIKDISLEGDKQLLKVGVKFDRKFEGKDAPKDAELASTLDKFKPHIVGELVVYAGLTGGVTPSPETPKLELRLLPSLSSVSVSKLEIAEKYDVDIVSKPITAVLNQFRDNVSGELTRASFSSVDVPALSTKPFDLSGPLKLTDPNIKVSIAAKPITAPFRLDGFAWLITNRQLTAIAQLSPVAVPMPAHTIAVEKSYDGVKKRVTEIVDQVMDVPDADSRTWVAVKKDVIAVMMNSVFAQASACISGNATLPNQHSENKIAMPNGAGVDCAITRSCDPKQVCTFSAQQVNRDCSACVLRAPRICGPWHMGCVGGQCSAMGQDPVCQAAKVGQQTLYNIDANARKADCDRLRETERVTCQAEVAAEHALCQAKKTALDALGKTGNFANLVVDAALKAQDVQVCLKNFTLSPALDHIQLALDVTGSASADVNLQFMPLDAGHLVCPIKWSKSAHLEGILRESRIDIASSVSLRTDKDVLSADFKVDKISVKPTMKPGPTELLLKTPQLFISCPVIQFVAPVVVQLTPFIPQLRGEFDMSLPEQRATVPVPPFKQDIGNRPLTVTVGTTSRAIVASARVSPETLKADAKVANAGQ